jgi:membrane protease YdiL (CAAX protease family)
MEQRRFSLAALVAALLVTAVVIPYAILIDPSPARGGRTLWVTVSLGVGVVAALLAAFPLPIRTRAALLGLAGGVFVLWGVLGALSIGLPMIVAAVLTLTAARHMTLRMRDELLVATAMCSSAALVALGVALT